MIFEIIDPKQKCKNIFLENQIVETPVYEQLSQTWAYHASLEGYDIQYANLYAQRKSLDECCPAEIKDEWNDVKKRHCAYIKSFQKAKCEFEDECFYDLVPRSFVVDYFKVKSQITKHVLNHYPKPSNYDFLVELSHLLAGIRNHKLKINTDSLVPHLHSLKARSFYTRIAGCRPIVDYNLFGTITGRLTTYKNSFPILTMNKDYRRIVEPHNDWFIELDFNAAELRCLLALNSEPQPKDDIHTWHGNIINKLSDHVLEREDIKRKIFGWLYGPLDASLGIPQVEKYYDKRKALNKYWSASREQIINPFGRTIQADEFHGLNALIQSTTSDTFLRRAIAVNKLLKNRKSFTSALIHDSMVIDFDKGDKDLLEDLINEFAHTDLGFFKVNVSLGTNFGNMRKFR